MIVRYSNDEERTIRRGDVYYADLDPYVGSEQGGIRPVLVIQNNLGNLHSSTVIVVPLTSHIYKKKLPTQCILRDVYGLGPESLALGEQIRTIDKERLRSYMAHVPSFMMGDVDNAVMVSLGLYFREYTKSMETAADARRAVNSGI